MEIISLIVDDSEMMRKMVIRTLQDTEFKPKHIIEAEDGEDALQKYQSNSGINLILCDWNMPRMDGMSFVKKVREKDSSTVIIMVTTEGTITKMQKALENGVDNYVVKPFSTDDLQRKLKRAFKRLNQG